MTVKRIVANLAAAEISEVQDFYTRLFGLKVVMGHGWIVTLASGAAAPVQISIASPGGSGTPAPDLPIEADDVDAVFARAESLGCDIACASPMSPGACAASSSATRPGNC